MTYLSSENLPIPMARLKMLIAHPWLANIICGLLAFFLTSAPVWLGVLFGIDFVPHEEGQPLMPRPHFLTACSGLDGHLYKEIAQHGYKYDPGRQSNVAFFPGYPVAARMAARLTGWGALGALLAVSNLMLLAAFILFAAYLRSRSPKSPARNRLLQIATFGLWPAGLFFRMAYSESTFLATTLLVLLGIDGRWPLFVVAFLAGLATAVRPVGVAVTVSLLLYVFCDASRGSIGRRLLLALSCLPLACWGLIAYMAYQYAAFGTPLAFAQTQDNWHLSSAAYYGPAHKVEALLTAEPIWALYTPGPVGNWQQLNPRDPFLFNIFFWNPIFFVGALALVLLGWFKHWLTGPEAVLALGLLGIPYVTRAYEMSMASHARFAAVVVPAYMVLGRLLQALPEWVTWCTLALLSVILMAWSALFAAGHFIF